MRPKDSSFAPQVVHITTSHHAADVRIFERECRSLSEVGGYRVAIAGDGHLPSNSQVHLFPLGRIPSGSLRRWTVGLFRAWRLTRSLNPDLWHVHDPEVLPLVLWLARTGRKVIWDAHEDYECRLSGRVGEPAASRLQALTMKSLRLLIDHVDRSVAGVVAATPTIAARYSNRRTMVVGNEARLETFEGCTPTFESRQILFTGSTAPGHLFLETVQAVAAIPDVELAVAGREPHQPSWSEAKVKLGNRLRHLGWLDRPALTSAIHESILGMLTYENREAEDTAAANKAYEFAAGGLPVIATPNKVNIHNINHLGVGFLARDFTSDALQSAIELALSNSHAWNQASQDARAWARRDGTWKNSEAKLLGLYRELIGDMTIDSTF